MIHVGPQEAHALLAEKPLDVVDVREPREWATGHLPGARLVPLDELTRDPQSVLPHDGVMFVCARGGRSETAARLAERLGLAEVYTLDGGTDAWVKAGLTIEVPPPPREPTEPTRTTVLRRSNAVREVSPAGHFSSRALFPVDQSARLEVYELWLAPRAREEAAPRRPGTRATLAVTGGALLLEVGGERHAVEAGDAIVFAADSPHVYENPGDGETWMHLVLDDGGGQRG